MRSHFIMLTHTHIQSKWTRKRKKDTEYYKKSTKFSSMARHYRRLITIYENKANERTKKRIRKEEEKTPSNVKCSPIKAISWNLMYLCHRVSRQKNNNNSSIENRHFCHLLYTTPEKTHKNIIELQHMLPL